MQSTPAWIPIAIAVGSVIVVPAAVWISRKVAAAWHAHRVRLLGEHFVTREEFKRQFEALGDTQTDGRGTRWVVDAVQQGGRVLVWFAWVGRRTATTTAVPEHPDYPSDAAVIDAARAAKRDAKARMRAR